MNAPTPLYAEAGRLGLVIPLAEFRARLGGEPALRKVLGALTVTEKVHAGRPRGMSRVTRKAYSVVRVRGAESLVIPRAKGPPFLRARTRAGLPLLDGIRAAPPGGGRLPENAPLPAPRRLAAERCAPGEPLYDYQEAAVEYLCSPAGPLGPLAVAGYRAAAYLGMGTGLGKTRVALGVIVRRGEPALFVVPTDEIGQQTIDEAAELYPDLVVGFYRNPPKTSRRVPAGPRTHDIVVVIVNTLRDKGPDFLEGYGTVVLDEAHEYHSPCNCRVLWLSQAAPAVLGLSATPEERPDGLDRLVPLLLGPVVEATGIPGFDIGAVSFSGEVRIVEYAGHPDHCETATTPAGTMSAILTIGNIIEDEARLRLVAAEVDRLYRLHETAEPDELLRLGLGPRPVADATPTHPAGEIRRHGVFVFAEHREYLPALRRALLERLRPAEVFAPELDEAETGAGAPLSKVSILRGGVARTAVRAARRAGAHVVLTTYGFSRRGISLPDMTALVQATPRRNGGRQILGRVARRGSDESIVRQVVDFVDVRTGLRGQVSDRRKVYAEKKYPETRIAVSWEDYPAPEPALADADAEGVPAKAHPPGVEGCSLEGYTLDDLLAAALGDVPPRDYPLAGLGARGAPPTVVDVGAILGE